ncbi:MAG: prefoldin subunit alpha, partial [Thaumarchaeota archaeon]|nr:prefoldin subunit alpha [Nitrososphaerota archaeon]
MSEEQAQALLQQMQAYEGYMADLLQKEESVVKLLQEATGA